MLPPRMLATEEALKAMRFAVFVSRIDAEQLAGAKGFTQFTCFTGAKAQILTQLQSNTCWYEVYVLYCHKSTDTDAAAAGTGAAALLRHPWISLGEPLPGPAGAARAPPQSVTAPLLSQRQASTSTLLAAGAASLLALLVKKYKY